MLSRLDSLEVGRGPWNALSINHRGLYEENTEEEVNRVTQELFKLLGMIGRPPISPGKTQNWLVVWNMNFIFPYIGNVIIPTDLVIFFRGVGQPPIRQNVMEHEVKPTIVMSWLCDEK